MLADNIEFALKNIRKRVMRSSLTVLGISIGIMGIVALNGLSAGMTQAVLDELAPLSDTIFFYSTRVSLKGGVGDQGGSLITREDIGKPHLEAEDIHSINEPFTERDIEDIGRIDGVNQISLFMSGYAQLSFDNDASEVKILGMDPNTMRNVYGEETLSVGKLIRSGEQNRCVVGYSVANEYFDREMEINSKILLNGEKFVIKGIYKKEGGGLWSQNDVAVHVTSRDFEKVTGENNVDTVIVKVTDVNKVEAIAAEVIEKVNENHGYEDLFSAITMTAILDRIMQVIAIIETVLLGVASIALVVASIGIMNMMLTAVIERTHEIGVMKAIGATKKNVLFMFLSEGALISFIGGILGVILGYIGAAVICSFVSNFIGAEFTAVITPVSVVFALCIALLVGIVFSFYPAKRAADMSPLAAIAYE